jgi:Zn-dependent protease with chaperone function
MGLKINKIKVIPKIFNAYARGKDVFVGEESLRKLDLYQLKALFAHEFGHVKGHHNLIQLLYISPIVAYLWLTWHNLPPIMLDLGLVAYLTVAMIPLAWELERRADRTAVKYVGKEPMKSTLLAMEESGKVDEPSETHPPISKRLKWIDKIT